MVVTKAKNVNVAIQNINDDLNRLYEWFNFKKLKLNVDKTDWMMITKDDNIRSNNQYEIKIGTEIIKRVNSMKYLGILIDEKLNFAEQVKMCTKKWPVKSTF